jgi:hypothetical protein
MTFRGVALALALAGATTQDARAAVLPAQLTPTAPFPLVIASNVEREFVAPGVSRATYHLFTSSGPLNVFVVVVDPHEPTVRLDTVLAHDRLTGSGETVSSMAQRTGAVAGINADYFDVGNTNQPLGVVVAHGEFERTPSVRPALTYTREREVRFETYRFAGHATAGTQQFAITHLNEFPPEGGASLMTPAFGPLAPNAAVTTLDLEPIGEALPPPIPAGGAPRPAAMTGTRYRLTAIESGTFGTPASVRLALGPAALANVTLPGIGDEVDISVGTDPDVGGVLAAVGGGPLLLADGKAVDDPISPGYAERALRIPVAAAAKLGDGRLALVTIDGRHPPISIGTSRAELIALLQAIGATDALQFDSGGSATLVARVLGDAKPSVLNAPSDGTERAVADGLFVYSDAPLGTPSRLAVHPALLEGLRGVTIPVRAAIADAAGHALGAATGPWTLAAPSALASITTDGFVHLGLQPGAGTLHIARGGVSAEVPLAILPAVARLSIDPDRPNPDPGTAIALHAVGYDAAHRLMAIGENATWSALGGTIDPHGIFTAGTGDATVTATLGSVQAKTLVRVGRRFVPAPFFDLPEQGAWHFSSTPTNNPGALTFASPSDGSLRITYDFTDKERAAYATATPPLSLGDALALGFAIDGDASGVSLRVSIGDRFGERTTLTIAPRIDWTGIQLHDTPIPSWLAPPLALRAIYLTAGSKTNKPAGTITLRNVRLLVPGSGTHAP